MRNHGNEVQRTSERDVFDITSRTSSRSIESSRLLSFERVVSIVLLQFVAIR